ncbi:MAG: glycosyltransferase family 39 protein [Alphaproteobacteria bacterium]|nr:glycosyltransferase family 39 protein [Alphaproteobacteria bacterium]
MDSPRPLRDPYAWAALTVGLVLRALPMLVWGWSTDACTRDECIYKIAARPILAGDGLGLAPAGWLPAPGYPYLLALCHTLFGSFESVKWVQWGLTAPTLVVLYLLAHRVGGRSTARWMVWGFALHPTFVFFVGTMWTETTYTFLLASSVLAVLWARDGGARRGLVPGLLLGLTVLSRGVATYLAPLMVLALLAPDRPSAWAAWRQTARTRARHGLAFLVALLVTVAPYSLSASSRWDGMVISDATLGHVAALGNNTFPPVTFDYGIGQLTGRLYARTLASGRPRCGHKGGPVAYDRCEVDHAVTWIGAHPATFVERVPVRLAQLFNPHSFLTRHVRWGYWPGLPWALKELLVTWQMLTTIAIVLLGSLVAWARARGPYGLLATGIVLYHLVVIASLYGLTRFRLPLEPLWMVFLALGLAEPRATWRALTASRWRAIGAIATTPVIVLLLHHYAWTGYPGFGP